MSDQNHEFVSIGINLGAHRLTISGESVVSVLKHLNDLTEPDEIEGTSALDTLLDHVGLINAGIVVKDGFASPSSAPATAPVESPATVPNCDTHNRPMKWVADGVAKSGQNAGKHYSAFQCTAPFTPGSPKCGMKNFTWK